MWREHLFFLLPFVFRNMGISTRVQVHHGEWWVEDLFIFWYVSALFPFGPLKGTLFYTIQHPSTPSTVSHHQIIQRFRATLSPGISSLSRKLHWKIYHPPYCVCICEHYRQRDHLQPCGDLTQSETRLQENNHNFSFLENCRAVKKIAPHAIFSDVALQKILVKTREIAQKKNLCSLENWESKNSLSEGEEFFRDFPQWFFTHDWWNTDEFSTEAFRHTTSYYSSWWEKRAWHICHL